MEPFLREDQFERLFGLLQQEPKIHTKDPRAGAPVPRSGLLDGPQRGAVALPAGGIRPVEQRLQALRPLGWLGVWERLFQAVADEPDLQSVMVDATVVRAHACAASAPNQRGIRRPKGLGAPGAASAPSSTSSWMRSATRSSSS